MENKRFTFALAGNPNSGKTTIFNNITGTRQKVGNWPGVTVEKKEGIIHKFGYELKIVDLPGTYSLTPFSIEEIVARNFIIEQKPDVVIAIIDASSLERSLYLATQLRELDCKVIFALNMADMAESRGIKIHHKILSELLSVPVVFTVANKNEGIDTLLQEAVKLAESDFKIPLTRKVKYSADIENALTELAAFVEANADGKLHYSSRWTAVKLLENDKIIKEKIAEKLGDKSHVILTKATALRAHLINRYDDDPEIVMTDERYGFIAGIAKEVVVMSTRKRIDISRNIDLVLTNRFAGFPIFIFFIWFMFQMTFSLGSYPMQWIESGVSLLSTGLSTLMPDNLLKDLLIDGIFAGIGSVIVFLPNILILFFFIALFEDTGYMARAAFLMDKIMHLIGLHGKSFIPMLIGFGCNVPAIMSARTLESNRDRILTILITPFMSCSAKLPVYIVLAGTFFAHKAGTVIFALYITGIVISIVSGRIFRNTILKGVDAPFVMELPPYRVPMFKSLMIHMWDRGKIFLRKMGGIILIGSTVVWVLSSFPRNIQFSMDYEKEIAKVNQHYASDIHNATDSEKPEIEKQKNAEIINLINSQKAERAEQSYIGRIGKLLSPVFAPIGIDWRGSVALLSGFVAKEIVVSTLGVLFSSENKNSDALKNALRSSSMTPLSALSLMVFVLLYLPCIATISAINRETGSAKWAMFSIAYNTSLAWAIACVIYQGGKILGFN